MARINWHTSVRWQYTSPVCRPSCSRARYAAPLHAMTLIELVLVMALLVIVLGLSVPALSTFFSGRRTSEEARRLLALTLYARSEAISKSTQIEVWLDPNERKYGMRSLQPVYEKDISNATEANQKNEETQPVEYQLAADLDLEIDQEMLDEQGLGKILFLPDGTIDENSISSAIVRKEGDEEYILERRAIGVGYSIR